MTDSLKIGDKTELGLVLYKDTSKNGTELVFSDENKFCDSCIELEKSEKTELYFTPDYEDFERVLNCHGNRIDDEEILNCIFSNARPQDYDEVVGRILAFEDLMHRFATVENVKKIIAKVQEEDYN